MSVRDAYPVIWAVAGPCDHLALLAQTERVTGRIGIHDVDAPLSLDTICQWYGSEQVGLVGGCIEIRDREIEMAVRMDGGPRAPGSTDLGQGELSVRPIAGHLVAEQPVGEPDPSPSSVPSRKAAGATSVVMTLPLVRRPLRRPS